MRFPHAAQLQLPCLLEHYTPGRLHPDGRRYLPLIALRLPEGDWPGAGSTIGVVDRHHRVSAADEGRQGSAQLVFLLSQIALAAPDAAAGVYDQPATPGSPALIGQVLAVPTWETETEHLPYQALHAELLLAIGAGTVGVRTNATAPDLAALIGTRQITPGDRIRVWRSRIDILGFTPSP